LPICELWPDIADLARRQKGSDTVGEFLKHGIKAPKWTILRLIVAVWRANFEFANSIGSLSQRQDSYRQASELDRNFSVSKSQTIDYQPPLGEEIAG